MLSPGGGQNYGRRLLFVAGSEMNREARLGLLLVALGAVGFSSAILFNRLIVALSGVQLSFFRALVAFLFFSWLRALRHVPTFWHRRDLRLWLLGLALTVGATSALYMIALRMTTAATAVLLNNTSALYVALLAPLLLHEPLHPATCLSLPLTLIGMVLVTRGGGETIIGGSWSGIALGALSGFSYALTMLISRRLRDHVDSIAQA